MFRWELTAMAICVLITFERSLVRLFFTAKPNVHDARIAFKNQSESCGGFGSQMASIE
jgi:hypothetical protein